MRVLVTGGAGRLGRYIADELSPRHEVVIFDALAPADSRIPAITGDIRSFEAVERALDGVDAVIHLAAIPMYTGENQNIWDVNVNGTFNVVEAAAQRRVQRVVFASSICAQMCIGWEATCRPSYLPLDEEHPNRPDDTYGLSKLIGEQLCYAHSRRYGLETVCLRMATVWFPFLPDNTRRFANHVGMPQALAGFLWNYVDARDAARAFGQALELDRVTHEVFNIGAAETCADMPTLELISRFYPEVPELHNRSDFLTTEYAPLFDIQRAREQLGYEPVHSWREYAAAIEADKVAV
jgi:UDP-glucose 4-epimerase